MHTNVFHVTNPQVIGLPAPSSLNPKFLRASGAPLGTATGSLLHDLMLTPAINGSIPGSSGAERKGAAVV